MALLLYVPIVILVFKNKLLLSVMSACKYQYSVKKCEYAHCGQFLVFLNGYFCRTGFETTYFHIIGSGFVKPF